MARASASASAAAAANFSPPPSFDCSAGGWVASGAGVAASGGGDTTNGGGAGVPNDPPVTRFVPLPSPPEDATPDPVPVG